MDKSLTSTKRLTRVTKEIAGKLVSNPNQFRSRIDDDGRCCTKCDIYKYWDEYAISSKTVTGRASSCTACVRNRVGMKPRVRNVKRERAAQKISRVHRKATKPLSVKAANIRSGMRRRAKHLPAPSTKEILEWLEAQPMVCAYTAAELSVHDFSVDHRTPLERGGTNDLGNLCVCTKEVNTTKGTMTEAEFRALIAVCASWDDKGTKLFGRLRMAGKAFSPGWQRR